MFSLGVMFAISMLTFLLFAAMPNGDPAARLAGRNARPRRRFTPIDVKYGFDKPIYVQCLNTMREIFTGQAYSYTQGFNVLDGGRARASRDAVTRPGGRHHLADRRRSSWARWRR